MLPLLQLGRRSWHRRARPAGLVAPGPGSASSAADRAAWGQQGRCGGSGDVWNQARQTPAVKRGRGRPGKDAPPPPRDESRWVKHSRWALLKDPDKLKPSQLDVLHELRRSGSVLYRCWQLKEGLRDLYRLADPADAPTHLRWWLAWACRCRIPAFVTLAKTIRANRERILAAVELGPIELQTRRHQQQNQADQPPRLRPPLRRGPHRDDLPMLRRDHHRSTHRKVRSPGFCCG